MTENKMADDVIKEVIEEEYIITEDMLKDYRISLQDEEKSILTVGKYIRDLKKFQLFLDGRHVKKELVIEYKKDILCRYAVNSVNSMLAALNRFFQFTGWHQFKVRQVKQQRQVYCPEETELTKNEYFKLLDAAKMAGNERLGLIMQTICSTGIRISELACITVKAAREGVASVDCKGKQRQVLLPGKLRKLLMWYSGKNRIKGGSIFVTRQGRPMDRSNIWREMKQLCIAAGVDNKKVFPHNLRHLFAKTYYKMEKDIVKLADLLGHSSINTTRIYIISSGTEHRKQIERLRLII